MGQAPGCGRAYHRSGMRPALLAVTLVTSSLPLAAAAGDGPAYKHAWRAENDGTRLVSTYAAPQPYSMTGEPEATLVLGAAPAGRTPMALEKMVEDEVKIIRKGVTLADYGEQDGRSPDGGVATWFQQIAGQRVGFIKYRVAGVDGKYLPAPRSVIHAIAYKGDLVYFFHLVVVFAGHQDEVRGDQIRMIEHVLSM